MSVRYSKLGGQNSLSYLGISAISPAPFIAVDRAPISDVFYGPVDDEFAIGTLWLDTSVDDMWVLATITANEPLWVRISEVFDNIFQIETDSGTVYPLVSDGSVDVDGGAAVSTSGVGNTLSLTLANGTDGQLLIASTSGDTDWATIASSATVNVTNGANTINIESTVPKAFDTLTGDSGTATPVAGNIDLAGGLNITTSSVADIITVSLDDSPDIPGTLTVSMLASAGIMRTNSSGFFSTSAGTDGQLLVAGGTTPSWTNIISSDASIVITNGANTINLETSATPGLNTLTADDTNTASPVLGKIDVIDSGSIYTSASTDTFTVDLQATPDITSSLTLSPLTTDGVLSVDGAGVVTSSSGTDGQVIIGGGTDPAWANITAGTNMIVTPGANSLAIDTSVSVPSGSYSFMAYQPSNNLVGKAITYYLGWAVILTEVFDSGGNFYPGNALGTSAVYTAPVDGIYYLQYNHVAVYIPPPPPAPPVEPPVTVVISTTNQDFKYHCLEMFAIPNITCASVCVTTHLDAGDTVRYWSNVDYDYVGVRGHVTDAYTYVSGYLVSAD